MLKVKEVTKRYVSKKGNECDALRGVSFDLPEKGLYFILGKSGSGKSTLLNLLGGLDTCTGGEIVLNGLNISKMDAAQLDVYRNEYLGFIFQEFNLIDNLSVTENVSLPLSLQSIKVEGQVEKAMEEVGLSGMGARFPDELSGGQKQRVAIARALIKNPKIILADEPTGNLDSQTGKDIFELLVSLSESKLIIVVSHDAENAQKYGDGIIELEDGKVVNNTCPPSEEVKEETADLKKYRTNLPSSFAFKMGVSNLLKKKIRSISCIFIAILAIASIALSQMILSYTPEYGIYRQAKNDGISHIVLQGDLKPSTLACIKDKWGTSFIEQWGDQQTAISKDYILVENEEEIISAGYEFVGGHLPLDEESVFISEEYLQELSNSKYNHYYVYEDGEFVILDKKYNKADIVGKRLCPNNFGTYDCMIVAGIIGTAADKVTPDNSELLRAELEWNSTVNCKFFALKSTFKQYVASAPRLNIISSSGQCEAGEVAVYGSYSRDVGIIYTENGIVDDMPLQLADNEVIISYDLYKLLFPDAKDLYYYSANIFEHLNDGISLTVKERQGDYVCKTYENMILKGVSFKSPTPSDERIYKILLNSTDKTTELYYDTMSCKSINVNLSTAKNLHGLLKDMRTRDVTAYVVNSDRYYGFEETRDTFYWVFIALSIVLSVILLLFVINLISVSIKNQQKEIGILRALGARSKDIFKIYIFEGLFLAVIPLIVCFGGAFPIAWLCNIAFAIGYTVCLNLLFVNWLTVLIILFASVVLIGIATVIPLKKIVKMRPIDAIRNL